MTQGIRAREVEVGLNSKMTDRGFRRLFAQRNVNNLEADEVGPLGAPTLEERYGSSDSDIE
jgi:hypothetical protein